MSAPERTRIRSLSQWHPRPGDLRLAAGTLAALVAALVPLLRVISLGWWLFAATGIAALILATGIVARGLRLPAVGVTVAQVAVWIASVTGFFFAGTSILLVVPTRATFEAAVEAATSALEDVQYGSAPLAPNVGLSIVLAALTGVLAVVFDHVVVTARMPLLAAVGFIALSLAPAIAVPGDFDPGAFIILAICILFLIRTDTRLRREQADAGPTARSSTPAGRPSSWASPSWGAPWAQNVAPARSSTAAMAASTGAIALIVALVLTPLLPPPAVHAGFGGVSVSIDASLRLGDDLRRPVDTAVLTVRTTGSSAPYLRVATLSQFSGRDWQPDAGQLWPVARASSFEKVTVDPGIALTKVTTTVDVVNLSTRWLPIPFPAVGVANLGAEWSLLRDNRTIVGAGTTAAGQSYQVTTEVPRPTSQQIRASSATELSDQLAAGALATITLPDSIPADIASLAHEVTAGAATDYDALLDLQTWFRGPAFTYSLLAPRTNGFDNSGLSSIDAFLKKKEGYCIHFASAFAVMARILGMHSRIVVGYLPGSASAQLGADPSLFTVMSSQLHAWPEVYFDGIGWVPFEPTKGLGTPTAFAAAVATGQDAVNQPTPTVTSGSAAPQQGKGGAKLDQTNATGGSAAAAAPLDPAPWIGGLVGLLIAAAVPALIGVLRRRRLLAAAHEESAPAAWMLVQEAAIDIGMSAPASESPRAFAARLAHLHPVPPDALAVLLAGIERASYGRGGLRGQWQGEALADAAASVRAALLASVPAGARWRAVLMPRSLFVRPGSVYAAASA